VTTVAIVPRLADPVGMGGAEIQNNGEGFRTKMRLVSQGNDEMGQVRLPAWPPGSTLEGAEHALFGRWIEDRLGDRAGQTVEFGLERVIILGAHDRDLFGAKLLPLSEQMTEDGSRTPRQEQLWPAHPLRTARGEDDCAEGQGCICGRGRHARMIPGTRI